MIEPIDESKLAPGQEEVVQVVRDSFLNGVLQTTCAFCVLLLVVFLFLVPKIFVYDNIERALLVKDNGLVTQTTNGSNSTAATTLPPKPWILCFFGESLNAVRSRPIEAVPPACTFVVYTFVGAGDWVESLVHPVDNINENNYNSSKSDHYNALLLVSNSKFLLQFIGQLDLRIKYAALNARDFIVHHGLKGLVFEDIFLRNIPNTESIKIIAGFHNVFKEAGLISGVVVKSKNFLKNIQDSKVLREVLSSIDFIILDSYVETIISLCYNSTTSWHDVIVSVIDQNESLKNKLVPEVRLQGYLCQHDDDDIDSNGIYFKELSFLDSCVTAMAYDSELQEPLFGEYIVHLANSKDVLFFHSRQSLNDKWSFIFNSGLAGMALKLPGFSSASKNSKNEKCGNLSLELTRFKHD